MAEKENSSNNKKTKGKNSSGNSSSKLNSDDKVLAILTHLLGLFISFLGPLIIYLVSEDKNVREHSKNALNWQISAFIYAIVSSLLVFIVIGIPLLIVVSVLNIVFPIIAAVKASENEKWLYPLTIPFFS